MAGPVAFLAPDPIQSQQFIPGGNTPAAGGLLFVYQVGSSTKTNSYTDPSASTARTNPIVLDSGGNIPGNGEVWITSTAKFVLAPSNDGDPPTSPYWTRDNYYGINNITQAQVQSLSSQSEWVQGSTATFVGVTAFSVVGDQTLLYTLGRRVKATVTGGDRFGIVTSSVLSANSTAVGVTLDSSTLNGGLSSLSYGILSTPNGSVPWSVETTSGVSMTGNIITSIVVSTQTLNVTSSSVFNGSVSTQVTGTTYISPSGRLFVNANITSTPTTSSNIVLMPYSIPANTFSFDGKGVRFSFMGATVNNANVKSFSINYGGGSLLVGNFTASLADIWRVNGEVVRVASSTQRAHFYMTEGLATLNTTSKFAAGFGTGSNNDASPILLQMAFTATTGAADISQTLSLIEYIG